MNDWMNEWASALGDLGITSYIFCDHTNGVWSSGGNKMKYSACVHCIYNDFQSNFLIFFFF